MQLLYFPGPDILEIHLDETAGAEVETVEGPIELLSLHFKEGRLVGLTLEDAVETAPTGWRLPQVRRDIVEIANKRDEFIASVCISEQGEILSVQEGDRTASTSSLVDEAIDIFNELTRGRGAD